MRVSFFFEPRDLWVGVFWRRMATWRTVPGALAKRWTWDVFLCLLPCLVLKVSWTRPRA